MVDENLIWFIKETFSQVISLNGIALSDPHIKVAGYFYVRFMIIAYLQHAICLEFFMSNDRDEMLHFLCKIMAGSKSLSKTALHKHLTYRMSVSVCDIEIVSWLSHAVASPVDVISITIHSYQFVFCSYSLYLCVWSQAATVLSGYVSGHNYSLGDVELVQSNSTAPADKKYHCIFLQCTWPANLVSYTTVMT